MIKCPSINCVWSASYLNVEDIFRYVWNIITYNIAMGSFCVVFLIYYSCIIAIFMLNNGGFIFVDIVSNEFETVTPPRSALEAVSPKLALMAVSRPARPSSHQGMCAALVHGICLYVCLYMYGNLVSFNQSKTKSAVISRNRNQNFSPVLMNGDVLDTLTSFIQLGLSFSSNLTWKTLIHSLAKHSSQKRSFLARAHGVFLIFSPANCIQVPNHSFFRVLLPRLVWLDTFSVWFGI